MKFSISNGRAIDSSARPFQVIEPYRTQTVHADVTVPLYQAVIGASLVGAVATVTAWCAITFILKIKMPELTVLGGVFALAFTGAFAYLWFTNVGFSRSTIIRIERAVGVDLDGDGKIGNGHPLKTNKTPSPPHMTERDKFREFVTHCYEFGTTYAALRQWYRDPDIDRYVTWCLEYGIGKLRGRTNKSGWETTMDEAEALKLVDGLEWIERGKK